MDGTYGNPLGRSQSPATPSTPVSQYQVNIQRKKTKKWIEAKAPSYDGGGWGDDDESSDEQEPVPAVPQPATGHSSRLPSESRRPFAPPTSTNPLDAARAANTDTQQSAPTGATNLPQPANPTLSPYSPNAPDALSHGTSVEPARLERSGTGGSNFMQPRPTFDTYDGNNGQGPQGYSLQDTGKPLPANPPSGLNEPVLAQPRDINRVESSPSPKLPHVLRTSGFGVDMFAQPPSDFSKAADATVQQESQPSPTLQKPLPPGPAEQSSPLTTERDSQPTTAPAPGVETNDWAAARRPSLPGGWVTETPSNADIPLAEEKGVDDGLVSRNAAAGLAHDNEEGSSTVAKETTPSLDEQQNDQPALSPLQTGASQDTLPNALSQTSGGPSTDDAQQRQSHDSTSTRSDAADIPPTQPLQPRKSDFPPADYDLQPIHRQVTQSTVTSSPVKESDMLRDEIMRSLSPAKEDLPDNKPPGPARQDTQQSNYSLGGYDDYWANASGSRTLSDAKSASAEASPPVADDSAPNTAPEEIKALGVTPLNTQTEAKGTTLEPASASRQRFSWEVSKPPAEEPAEANVPSSDTIPGVAPSTDPVMRSPTSDTSDSTARDAQLAKQATSPGLSLLGSPPGFSGPTSPQPSTLNATLSAKDKAGLPEPPSPVSAISDPQASSVRQSLPGEQPPTVTSPTPPPAVNVAPASPITRVGTQPQIMAFRDIMGMPTAAERIEKYDETREAFAKLDSGLQDWMTNLKAQHPEHADQTSSFYGAGIQSQGSALSVGTATGAQTSQQQQQPYYQQYLNASSPAVNAPVAGRSRFGTLPMPSQGATSTFGTSGNQIGTKGKEFMQTAGKMGKGLFNKGKSKLRGTGDKEPKKALAAQPKTKHERRTSWGLSLGGRVRTDSPGPQSGRRNVSATTTATRIDTPPPPPQGWQGATAATWSNRPSHDSQGRQSPALHDRINNNNMPPAVVRGERTSLSGSPRDPSRTGAWQPVAIGRPSMDRVSMESDRQAGPGNRTFTPEPAYNRAPSRPQFAAIPEDSGVALPPPDSESNTPRRNSFVGLPPIRRNSTLSSFDFLGDNSSELHSFLKLDDDETPSKTPESQPITYKAPETQPVADKALPEPPSSNPGKEQRGPNEPGPPTVQHGEKHPPLQETAPAVNPQGVSAEVSEPVDDREEKSLQEQVKPIHEEQPTESQQRQAQPPPAPNAQWQESAPSQPPPQQTRMPPNPIHQMFPAGSWKLEESHLVEPLNSVTRNRPGTGMGSPQPESSSDGFEKETGVTGATFSGTDELLPIMVPGRSRNADVPPSSARRYPELFPPRTENGVPRVPGPVKNVAQQDYHQYMITQSRGGRPNGSSSQNPDTELAREEPTPIGKTPGGLRHPGQRIPYETPRDGRPRSPDLPPRLPPRPRPDSPDLRGDEVSETSVVMDGRKKKRSSLLPGLRNANSTDVSLPLSRETSHNRAQTPDSFARSEAAESQTDRKRSIFSTAAGAISGKSPLKFAQSAASRSTQAVQQTAQGNKEPPPSKNRLAGLTNLASKINRVAQGHGRKPGVTQPAPTVTALPQVPETKEQPNPSPQAATQDAPTTPDSPMFPPHPAIAVGDPSQVRHKKQASGSGQEPDPSNYRPTSRPQAKDEPAPRKVSGGSLSPTHKPTAAGVQYPGAPPHGPPQQPLPSIPAAPGSSRGASLEDRRPSNQFEQPRASPRAPDFSAAQKSPPVVGTFPRPSLEKPSATRQAKHSHERQSSGQWNNSGGPRSPPFPRTQNAQVQQPGPDDEGKSRAMAASPEPPAKPEGPSQQAPPKARPSGNGHIAMLQQSPKPSIDLAGSSNQQPGSQWQQGSPARPTDNAQGAGRGGQAGGQASRWKGLRSRMSEQISHAAPRAQGKAGGTSSKLLGAIKRGPTDQTTTVTQSPGQGHPLSQWRPTQSASQQSTPPGPPQFQPLAKAGQQQSPQPGPLPGRPGPQQAPFRQQRQGEPQYDQVPIPQGYHAVRGEGRIAPSPYNIGQVQQPHQHIQQQQQMVPQGYQHQQQWPQTGPGVEGQNPSPPGQNAAPYQQNQTEQGDRRLSAIQGAGYIAGQQVQPPPVNNALSGHEADRYDIVQDTAQNRAAGGSPGLNQAPPHHHQQRAYLNTSPSMSGESSLDRRPSQVSQTSTQTGGSGQVVNGHGPKGPNTAQLGIDVQKAQQDKEVDLYDVTPKATTAPTGGSSVAAAKVELEDTEEARLRTLRLESQEDKILADPEEEAPQMSATSYPGQMWNPYGMEFVDWRDE